MKLITIGLAAMLADTSLAFAQAPAKTGIVTGNTQFALDP
jgi:hypothetical protein